MFHPADWDYSRTGENPHSVPYVTAQFSSSIGGDTESSSARASSSAVANGGSEAAAAASVVGNGKSIAEAASDEEKGDQVPQVPAEEDRGTSANASLNVFSSGGVARGQVAAVAEVRGGMCQGKGLDIAAWAETISVFMRH